MDRKRPGDEPFVGAVVPLAQRHLPPHDDFDAVDSTAHTVMANNGRSFDSGRLGKVQRYKHTFKRTAKKPYHCEIHPHMKGRITVKR